MKPNTTPVPSAISLSRRLMMNGASLGCTPRFTNDFARNPDAAEDQRHADRVAEDRLRVRDLVLEHVRDRDAEQRHGPEPANSHSARWLCTVPSRRCRSAPNDLKIAPWKMSVPTA